MRLVAYALNTKPFVESSVSTASPQNALIGAIHLYPSKFSTCRAPTTPNIHDRKPFH